MVTSDGSSVILQDKVLCVAVLSLGLQQEGQCGREQGEITKRGGGVNVLHNPHVYLFCGGEEVGVGT